MSFWPCYIIFFPFLSPLCAFIAPTGVKSTHKTNIVHAILDMLYASFLHYVILVWSFS